MIPVAPVPSWIHLLRICFMPRVDDAALARAWCKKEDTPFWFAKTAWSLVAIVKWWEKSFQKNKNIVVWLPGYFCNQSLWPLREYGKGKIDFVFYPLEEGFRPNWHECNKLVENKKPDIFILTHFFGFISDIDKSSQFCNQHNALFVEDAAHIMLPMKLIGKKSHYVLYSPHKFFPISHGALCIKSVTVDEYIKKSQGRIIDFCKIRASLPSGCYAFIPWLIRQIIKKITNNYVVNFSKPIPYELDDPNQPMPLKTYMNQAAKKLLFLEVKKIAWHVLHRRECNRAWRRVIANNNLKLRHIIGCDDSHVPYSAVFCPINNERASEIYMRLSNKKWPVSSWADLPPEVRLNPEFHKLAIYYRNNIIIFPVNQTIKVCALIKKYSGVV